MYGGVGLKCCSEINVLGKLVIPQIYPPLHVNVLHSFLVHAVVEIFIVYEHCGFLGYLWTVFLENPLFVAVFRMTFKILTCISWIISCYCLCLPSSL